MMDIEDIIGKHFEKTEKNIKKFLKGFERDMLVVLKDCVYAEIGLKLWEMYRQGVRDAWKEWGNYIIKEGFEAEKHQNEFVKLLIANPKMIEAMQGAKIPD